MGMFITYDAFGKTDDQRRYAFWGTGYSKFENSRFTPMLTTRVGDAAPTTATPTTTTKTATTAAATTLYSAAATTLYSAAATTTTTTAAATTTPTTTTPVGITIIAPVEGKKDDGENNLANAFNPESDGFGMTMAIICILVVVLII